MRPISLRVQGFTSFRDEQTVDFSDLDLFVLTGPTGSGKSSLLDAITYALFGKVERIGNQAGQLISQGQPRMMVTLDFMAGGSTFRITRTTPAKGTGKVLLERKEGEDWVSYGEGADSIREVNRIVPQLIGLDYDAFTRSVILPQGKFAEFLAGDAQERRKILTELLGLELFNRMAQHARQISQNAKTGFETKEGVLLGTYAGIDTDALKEAKTAVAEQQQLLKAAEEAESSIGKLEKQWDSASTTATSLRRCGQTASALASEASTIASALEEASQNIAAVNKDLETARKGLEKIEKVVERAGKAVADAEERSGSLTALSQLAGKADSFDGLTEELVEAEEQVRASEQDVTARRGALETAQSALVVAQKESLAADEALSTARVAHDEAHRSDLVGALTDGLKVGDPCPVCEIPLERLPQSQRKALETAKKLLADAQARTTASAEALSNAKATHALAEQALETARGSLERCKKELIKKKTRVASLEEELKKALGAQTVNARTELQKRIEELLELVEIERNERDSLDEARKELERRTLALERAQRSVIEASTRLRGMAVTSLLDQITDTQVEVDTPAWPLADTPQDPSALAAQAASVSKELERLADDLLSAAGAHDRELQELLHNAREMVPGLPATDDLTSLISASRNAVKQLTKAVVEAEGRVKNLEERLAERAQLEEEIREQRTEHVVYQALAKELRSDRIVSYLQAEALKALSTAGSDHLRDLSEDRYTLGFDDDAFYVIDAWNGNEKRNVKTLSGGETFLASLSLALALSEQVQYLSVSERGRLDSLFLDEGFDTLDSEFLEVVVRGLEQLSTDGRLVGVITHVHELAERLPVRLVVTKSPRGSTVRRDDPAFPG